MTTNATATILVLDPTASPHDSQSRTAPRLRTLRGRAIGFLWNSKPNGNILFEELERSLLRDHGVVSASRVSKPNSSIPATNELIAKLASSVDAVVVGIGD